MGLLNPIASKITLSSSMPWIIYTCPVDRSYSVIDMTFFKTENTSSSLIQLAQSTSNNSATLTSVDYFIDNIKLEGQLNKAELIKIIVGPGENIFAKLVSGPSVNIRVTGMEDSSNTKVLKAGRLAAAGFPGTSQALFYQTTLDNVAYVSGSLTIFNTSSTISNVQCWISSSSTPNTSDLVMSISIPANDTTIIENAMLLPNEKIYVQSDQPNTEYFLNGMVIAS